MSDEVLISHRGEEREPRLPRQRLPHVRVSRLHLAMLARASDRTKRDTVLKRALRRAKRTLAPDRAGTARAAEATGATKLRAEVFDSVPGFLHEPDVRPHAYDEGPIPQVGLQGRVIEVFTDGERLAGLSVTSFTTAARAQSLVTDSCTFPGSSPGGSITTKPLTVDAPTGAAGCAATFPDGETDGSVSFVRGPTLYRVLVTDGTADPTALARQITAAELAHLDARHP